MYARQHYPLNPILVLGQDALIINSLVCSRRNCESSEVGEKGAKLAFIMVLHTRIRCLGIPRAEESGIRFSTLSVLRAGWTCAQRCLLLGLTSPGQTWACCSSAEPHISLQCHQSCLGSHIVFSWHVHSAACSRMVPLAHLL